MLKTLDLYKKGKALTGGSQLYSKRQEVYAPEVWPPYYKSASGCTVTDLDNCTYLDFSTSGLGACLFGYQDSDIDEAVIKAIRSGSACSLNPPEEVELAEELLALHPWASKCRFTRSGGEAIAAATRLAEAATGRKFHWFKSYHGWQVNNPLTWETYISRSHEISPTTASVLVEPHRYTEHTTEDVQRFRNNSDVYGAVLVFDEISSGFRFNLGGSHLKYGVDPDIAVFAKAISNGYPLGAVLMNRRVADHSDDTFISSTSWSERTGPVAGLATIRKMKECGDLYSHLNSVGESVQNIWKYCGYKAGLEITVSGPPQFSHIDFGSVELQTLYTTLMLDYGFLAGKDFYPTYAHKEEHIEKFFEAVREVFNIMASAKDSGTVSDKLRGPVAEVGLKRKS